MQIYNYDPWLWFIGFMLFVFLGLILGSFSTALVYRIPRQIPWFRFTGPYRRSFCPDCSTILGIRDLVPVFSWLGSGGRCRHCGARISARYPVIELIVLIASITVFWFKGMSIETFLLVSFVPFLVALAVIDFEKMILPDQLTVICGALAILLAGWRSCESGEASLFIGHFLAAVIYGLASWILGAATGKLLGKDSLGFGDVKFFAVAGMGLGLEALLLFMIFSGGFGVLLALVWQLVTKSRIFPFGPALILAFFTLLLI